DRLRSAGLEGLAEDSRRSIAPRTSRCTTRGHCRGDRTVRKHLVDRSRLRLSAEGRTVPVVLSTGRCRQSSPGPRITEGRSETASNRLPRPDKRIPTPPSSANDTRAPPAPLRAVQRAGGRTRSRPPRPPNRRERGGCPTPLALPLYPFLA